MPKLPPTERLCQVLLLLLAGNGPAKIAQKMQRSDHTVKKHLRALYKLYEVEDGFGLMSVFIESSVLARLHARALELHKEQRDGSKPNCELHLEVRAHRPWVRLEGAAVVGAAAIGPATPPAERGWPSCNSKI